MEIKRKVLIPIGLNTNLKALEELVYLIPEIVEDYIVAYSVVPLPLTTSLNHAEVASISAYVRYEKNLIEAVSYIKSLGFKNVEYKISASHSIVDAIVEESIAGNYDLIVLVKRSRKTIFSKSVSASVLPKAPCPVLILKG